MHILNSFENDERKIKKDRKKNLKMDLSKQNIYKISNDNYQNMRG